MPATIDIFRHAKTTDHVAAGTTIFKEGDEAHAMYVIKSGEVEVWIKGEVVEILTAGGAFGEMALIETAPRSATIVARTDCELVPIDEKRFEFMVQQTPGFALRIMQIMSERLRKWHDRRLI